MKEAPAPYTCSDYRKEMILIGLVKRLSRSDLTDAERQQITADIESLEAAMDMD